MEEYKIHERNREDNDRFPVLTKESFWNAIKTTYPEAFAKFGTWIDEYKKRNKWDDLFNAGEYPPVVELKSPKYHELPIAMQLGIFIQYTQEIESSTPFEPDVSDMEAFAQEVDIWFAIESGMEEDAIHNNR